jgi:S1-C subfamily serine protease
MTVDGDRDRVKDQPLFEVDDTTTSYSPPRAERPRWVDRGRPASPLPATGGPVTAQHWFDPDGGPATEQHRPAPSSTGSTPRWRDARLRGPLVAGGVAIALVSAGLASAGTVGLLAVGGWLGEPDTAGGGIANTASQAPAQVRYLERPDTTRIAAEVTPAIVTVVVGPTTGNPLTEVVTDSEATAVIASGIVFDPHGYILTNRHAVCGAGSIVVLLDDGRQLPGQVYGLDSLTDLAIIKVDATDLPAADIGDSASLRPGQLSLVIGSSSESLTPMVRSGVVSALGRDLVVADPCAAGEPRALRNLIQTDARSGEGSTGAALVDAAGSVVGISTSVPSEAGNASYAIPINIAKPIMEQASDEKQLTRPWMGITYTALDASIAKAHGLSIDHGAWLRDSADGTLPAVVPGGPADVAGLRAGDVLTAIDDQRIDAAHSLDDILSQYRPEDQDPIEVWVLRDGTPMEIPLTLGSRTEGT